MEMYKNILVAIDGSDEASWQKPLASAVALARAFDAQLHVLSVIRGPFEPRQTTAVPVGWQWFAGELERRIASQIRRAAPDGLAHKIVAVVEPDIDAAILGVAEEACADLVVMGCHRPELKDRLLGTHSSHVARHAGCSVLVAREQEWGATGADVGGVEGSRA
jgi:nucleotide-binding universal stress UspA family protein